MTTISRADILASSRVLALRGAIVESFKARFPDIAVTAHVGRLDISDVLAKDIFTPPQIAIAATRAVGEGRLSGADDLDVELTAYIVADNLMIDGKLVKGDELALALFEAVMIALADPDFARWAVEDIGDVDKPKGGPLFTVKSVTQGAVYYAVTWTQTLYALGAPNVETAGETL